jgi:hypothetical protein
MVSSIRFSKQLIKKIIWESEMSISALSSDIRAVKNTNDNFLKSFGGLYNTNASTSYFKAVHSSKTTNQNLIRLELSTSV